MGLNSTINFRPLGSYVLVQREALPETTFTGLYVLGRDYPTVGRVLAVGPGKWIRLKTHYRWHRLPLDIRPGDFVQWTVSPNFDLSSVRGLPDNCLLLDYDDLNFRGRD
jgi:co-chaperonin GroES (HSP10)